MCKLSKIFRLRCSLVGLLLLACMGAALSWRRGDLFRDYYDLAAAQVQTMTLDEKIAQVLLVRYPDSDGVAVLEKNQFGGYVFFAQDFQDKTENEVKTMLSDLQEVAKIPILTAVDEEGGAVVRVSSNAQLAPEPFKSPRELYRGGGLAAIRDDTMRKSEVLENLGLNLNLAPVVDVATSPTDYMFSRSLGEDAELTAQYAQTVIRASQNSGVSYTLKHFPGYGNNVDTHTGTAVDKRSFQELVQNDLLPFRAGIDAGAEAVLVSHNIVTSVDASQPASLSPAIHELLRDQLKFTGVIITDDISMGALTAEKDVAVKALLAGNDLIITSDYQTSMAQIKTALKSQVLTEAMLDEHVERILAWKYYKGMLNTSV